MAAALGLYEDILANVGSLTLPALPRMIFVVHGTVMIDGRTIGTGEAWHGQDAVTVAAGPEGANCWRWDVMPEGASPSAAGCQKLVARLDTLPKGDLLLRGDSVGFPPGGCAYLHRHQGPGIRCLIEGGIRIDTHGRSTSLWARRRLVRERARPGVRTGGGRPAQPVHPRDAAAARSSGKKLASSTSTRTTRRSRNRSSTRCLWTLRSISSAASMTCALAAPLEHVLH